MPLGLASGGAFSQADELCILRRRTTALSGAACQFAVLIKEKLANQFTGERDMLDAIQISCALWGMIVCGAIKAAQLAHCLF
jgi:hypothetical protein